MTELEEIELIALSRGHCPKCHHRGFVIGPQGGSAINIECASRDCRQRYNVVFFAGTARWGHVIGNGKDGPPWPSEPAQ